MSIPLIPGLRQWHTPATTDVVIACWEEFDVSSHAFGKTTFVSALWYNGLHSWQDFSTGLFFCCFSLTIIVSYGRVLIQEEAALAVLYGAVGERREWTG